MSGLSRSLARVLLSAVGGALPGPIAWLVANALTPGEYAPALAVAAAAAIGLAAGLGAELISPRVPKPLADGGLVAWLLALLAVTFLCGVVVALTRPRVWQLQGATAVMVLLAFALVYAFAAGAIAGRWG